MVGIPITNREAVLIADVACWGVTESSLLVSSSLLILLRWDLASGESSGQLGFVFILSMALALMCFSDGMANFLPLFGTALVSFFTEESVLDLDSDGTQSTGAAAAFFPLFALLRFNAVGSLTVDMLLLILEAADAAAAEEAVAERRSIGVENMRRFVLAMRSAVGPASCTLRVKAVRALGTAGEYSSCVSLPGE